MFANIDVSMIFLCIIITQTMEYLEGQRLELIDDAAHSPPETCALFTKIKEQNMSKT